MTRDARHDAARAREATHLKIALLLILVFMAAEIVVALLTSSLALLSDAAHMLTDAAALALALVAAHLAVRPAKGMMTFGLGRAEILSAQANGTTLLVLALLIVYGAITHLIAPPQVDAAPVLVVALVGVAVNVLVTRILGGHAHAHPDGGHSARSHNQAEHTYSAPAHAAQTHGSERARRQHPPGVQHEHADPADAAGEETDGRSLNVEGSYQHILTDLFGFIATAAAAGVILVAGFQRADAIASLLIAALMLRAAIGLLRASVRVIMEAAPKGLDPDEIGGALAAWPGVAEVHDLHIWEVTSGFSAVSAHIVVDAGHDCHEVRRQLAGVLAEHFGLAHSTLQAEHTRAEQGPIQIHAASVTAPQTPPSKV